MSSYVFPFLALAIQSPAPESQDPARPAAEAVLAAQRDADAHNYIAMRLRLVKRGAAVEEIKSEIVNQIDFGTLTPRSVELLRRMMTLCDKCIANQVGLGAQLALVDQQQKQEDAKSTSGVAKLIFAGTTGNLMSALSALSDLDQGSGAASTRVKLQAQSAADLGAEVSAMEFDLAVIRSQVQAEGHLDASEFVTPADYDTFLAAAKGSSEKNQVAAVAKALEGSPRLEPAALNLAAYFFAAGEGANCIRYADMVIATAPRILRRDSLRGQAHAYKAYLALQRKEYPTAVTEAEAGIQDDPSSAVLIRARATGLVLSGDYPNGLPLFEKLALLMPDDSTVHYNLACCRAVAAKDAEGALKSLREALAKGFSDVAHARVDQDLALIRATHANEFETLTTMRLKVRLQPDRSLFGGPDILEVTNESAFPLLGVEIALTFAELPQSKRTPAPSPITRSVKIPRLDPGKVLTSKDLGQMLHTGFGSLRVVATGTQGRFEKRYTRKDIE